MKITHVHNLMLQKGKGIILMHALDADGKPFYLYMRSAKEDIQRLSQAFARQQALDFAEYGEILHTGHGVEPPFHIMRRMEAAFGFVH